jgi:hypothetical protein
MNMPGFTAEASDYKTPGNYRMAGTPNDWAGSRGVLPQGFCGTSLKNCVQGHLNKDPTAVISCDMWMAFCVTAGDWLKTELP